VTEAVEDLTQDDDKVRQTDNGWHEGDGPQPVQTGEPQAVQEQPRRAVGPQVAAVLQVAASQIGTVQAANGSNPYGIYYGMDRVAWCAEFVWWVFNHAGVGNLIPKSAYTPTFFGWFESHHQAPNDIQPGDVVFFDWQLGGFVNPGQEGRIDHVGIVEAVLPDGRIQTIEGNTTPPTGSGNQGQGGGVWRRQRSMSCVAGWGRPAYSNAPAPAPTPPPFDPNSLPSLAYGQTSPHVALFQKWSNDYPWSPEVLVIPTTGFYGDMTAKVVQQAAQRCGFDGGDGRNIGPKCKAAFSARGARW